MLGRALRPDLQETVGRRYAIRADEATDRIRPNDGCWYATVLLGGFELQCRGLVELPSLTENDRCVVERDVVRRISRENRLECRECTLVIGGGTILEVRRRREIALDVAEAIAILIRVRRGHGAALPPPDSAEIGGQPAPRHSEPRVDGDGLLEQWNR